MGGSMTDRYLAGHAEWRDPQAEPPPLATKLLLMNPAGVAVFGHWDSRWCIAWAPLPRKPEWLKDRLSGDVK
jgi:hypothetical protein